MFLKIWNCLSFLHGCLNFSKAEKLSLVSRSEKYFTVVFCQTLYTFVYVFQHFSILVTTSGIWPVRNWGTRYPISCKWKRELIGRWGGVGIECYLCCRWEECSNMHQLKHVYSSVVWGGALFKPLSKNIQHVQSLGEWLWPKWETRAQAGLRTQGKVTPKHASIAYWLFRMKIT